MLLRETDFQECPNLFFALLPVAARVWCLSVRFREASVTALLT